MKKESNFPEDDVTSPDRSSAGHATDWEVACREKGQECDAGRSNGFYTRALI